MYFSFSGDEMARQRRYQVFSASKNQPLILERCEETDVFQLLAVTGVSILIL